MRNVVCPDHHMTPMPDDEVLTFCPYPVTRCGCAPDYVHTRRELDRGHGIKPCGKEVRVVEGEFVPGDDDFEEPAHVDTVDDDFAGEATSDQRDSAIEWDSAGIGESVDAMFRQHFTDADEDVRVPSIDAAGMAAAIEELHRRALAREVAITNQLAERLERNDQLWHERTVEVHTMWERAADSWRDAQVTTTTVFVVACVVFLGTLAVLLATILVLATR